jgi:hypothetical protein
VNRSTLPRIGRDAVGARFVVFVPKDEPAAPDPIDAPAEGVASLDDEGLADLEERALAAFGEISAKESPTDEDVAEAERLAGLVTDVRTEQDGRAAANAERRSKLGNLAADLAPEDDADGDDASTDDAGDDAGDVDVPDDASSITDAEPAAVTAGAGGARTRARAADLAPRQKKPAPPARRPVTLVAAAEAPERQPGTAYADLMDVADAVGRRASEYPSTPFPGEQRVRMRHGIAMLRKDYEPGLVAASVTDSQVLDYAVDQSRLPGGSLIAAGGWCAPSETLYDLAEYEAADALVDLPEINVARGGIRFTPGPDFRSIFDGTGFSQTEAQAIAGQTKPCFRVDCPPFTEERSGVEGLCITAGILQNKAYPELTARVIRGALAAHAHRISAKTIARMVALSTAVPTLVNPGGGVATPTLNAIELAAEDIRYRHRMARGTVLEAVFPSWLLAAVRADLAWLGNVDALAVTDEQIRAWFTARRIRAQWVYDWQDSAIGQATAAARWPATVSFLIYAAGTFVRGMGDVISLDTVYDSAGLVENEFTGLFTEESLLVAKLGHDSRVYTTPIAASGFSAANGTVAVAPAV